jgi:hypothetical protein
MDALRLKTRRRIGSFGKAVEAIKVRRPFICFRHRGMEIAKIIALHGEVLSAPRL